MAEIDPAALSRLLQWFYLFMGLTTIETLIIVWAKRDVKIGIKKWYMKKAGKMPMVIRVLTPNKGVEYYVVATKGKGETIKVEPPRGLLAKLKKQNDDDGMLFFLEPEAIRHAEDGVPEITYTVKSVMPVDETQTIEQVKEQQTRFVTRFNAEAKKKAEKEGRTDYQAVEAEDLIKFTDPRRLNKWTDLTYLAAKRQALKESAELEKFVKWAFYAAAAAACIGVLTWWTLDGKALPLLQQIQSTVQNLGTTVLTPGG